MNGSNSIIDGGSRTIEQSASPEQIIAAAIVIILIALLAIFIKRYLNVKSDITELNNLLKSSKSNKELAVLSLNKALDELTNIFGEDAGHVDNDYSVRDLSAYMTGIIEVCSDRNVESEVLDNAIDSAKAAINKAMAQEDKYYNKSKDFFIENSGVIGKLILDMNLTDVSAVYKSLDGLIAERANNEA